MSGKALLRFFLSFLLIVSTLVIASAAQQRPVISGPVDDSVRVTIAGSRHPLAQPQFDVGSVDPATKFDRMLLVLSSSPRQELELQKFLDSQQDRTSPNYHHWLTPDEFAQKFGPAPQDIQAVSAWLQGRGFAVTSVARSGRWLEFSGTAGQTERAFNTLMRQYDIAGVRHIANSTDISVPAAIAPLVRGVVSLHNFFKKPMLSHYVKARSNGDGTYTPITPDATFNTSSGPVHALTPGDYAKIYQLSDLYASTPVGFTGTGITIAIVARSDASFADFSDFRRITGLPPGSLVNTLTLPPDPGFDPNNGDSVEVDLDSQWAGGVAPGANINVVVSASTATTDGVDLSSAYIVDHNLAPVMSVSFGACETDLGVSENAFFNSLWQQAAAQGISVMVSSGDSGAAGCDFAVQPTAATGGPAVSGLASTPFNTAVGGTEFAENGSAAFWSSTNSSTGVSVNGYIPEVAWNESCDPTLANSPCAAFGLFVLASTGGGASGLYPKPSWQTGIAGIPGDLARDIPDISLSAADHDGYIICFDLSCGNHNQPLVGIVGGTSASSPSFAGIVAIVNQAAGRQGLANYKLYELARQPSAFCNSAARTNPSVPPPSTCLFNDVVFGFNTVPGQGGFNAGTGFDLTTGLGSVNASNLVNAWKAITVASTTLAISSNGGATITGTHGTAVPLLATVTGQSATGGIPSGSVALANTTGPQLGAVAILPSTTNVASFNGTVSNLPGGSYNLVAHYPGDGQFAPSDSNTIAVNISPEASTTTLQTFGVDAFGFAVPATSFPYGTFMDIQANIAGASGQGVPTGTVTFFDAGTIQIGSAGVNLKGESEFFILGGNSFPAPLTIGTHSLSGNYSGDSSFNAGSSAPVTVTVTKGNPTVNVSPSANFIATQPGTLVAFVSPTGPISATGTIQFFDNGVSLGAPVTLPQFGNTATLQTTFNTEGQHPITASYSGDVTYNAAVSSAQPITVVAPFSIGGTNLTATFAAGQSTSFNLSVSNSTPSTFSGTVALTCSSSSPGVTCTVNPASVSINATTVPVPFTVSVSTTTSASLRGQPPLRWPLALSGVVAIALAGFSRKSRQPLLAVLALCLIAGATSCGGGGSTTTVPPPPPPPTKTTALVTGTSGVHVTTATLNLTITH